MIRFADDMLIVWEKVSEQLDDWKDFKSCVSQVSHLNWACEDLGEEAVFLDLEIWIDQQNNKCMRKSQEKKEYMFSCLPPH